MRPRTRHVLLAGSALAALGALSACGAGYGTGASTTTTGAPAAIGVRTTGIGPVIVDGSGLTLYLFEADTGMASTCSGACAANWPPALTGAAPKAMDSVSASLLGTTMRSDGTTQVTYSGHPLYRFVADAKPGDTRGQGINAFGAGWDALSPSGAKIEGGG
jgi:predicted lipoprotein with Yx(FWY)xxD motif